MTNVSMNTVVQMKINSYFTLKELQHIGSTILCDSHCFETSNINDSLHYQRYNKYILCTTHSVNVISSVQFSSVSKLCQTLCTPMDGSTTGFPLNHQLLDFSQIHIHWVGDAIESSHPLLPSSPALSLSQHQDLFQWCSSYQLAKILEFQLQSRFPFIHAKG